MINNATNAVLAHHGVLGQKWGVIRTPEQLGHKTAPKDGEKTVAQKKAELRYSMRSAKSMTDDELQAAINRLEKEKKYNELVSSQSGKKAVKKGKSMVSNILEKSGENIGTQLTTYALGTAVNKLLGSDVVNPKKGQKDK